VDPSISLPANYAKTNVKALSREIEGGYCITYLAPASMGKSNFLKYLVHNKAYKREYRSFSKCEFIYVDCTEIVLEEQRRSSVQQNSSSNQIDQSSTIEIYEKVIANAILNQITALNIDISNVNLPSGSKDLLYFLCNLFIERNKGKLVYIILDDSEKLLQNNLINIGEVLKFLRSKHRKVLNYIFTLDSTEWINILNANPQWELSDLMSRKFLVYKLIELYELFIPLSFTIESRLPLWVYYRTSKFKSKFRKVNDLSGGYLPYAKVLWASEDLLSNFRLTSELNLATKRLLSSLTQSQSDLLRKISLGEEVIDNFDLDYLIKTAVIKNINGKWQLFSIILDSYFKSVS